MKISSAILFLPVSDMAKSEKKKKNKKRKKNDARTTLTRKNEIKLLTLTLTFFLKEAKT